MDKDREKYIKKFRETGEIKYYLKYKGKMWKDGNKSDGYYFKEY